MPQNNETLNRCTLVRIQTPRGFDPYCKTFSIITSAFCKIYFLIGTPRTAVYTRTGPRSLQLQTKAESEIGYKLSKCPNPDLFHGRHDKSCPISAWTMAHIKNQICVTSTEEYHKAQYLPSTCLAPKLICT